MSFLDPDLGYDRRTAALGKRDWNYFTTGGGLDASEWEPGETPWAAHRITLHDRLDRTLGIPERAVTMWPAHTPPGPPRAERAAAVCRELLAADPTASQWPEPARCVALLEDVADSLYGRRPGVQHERLAAAARRYRVDAEVATYLATGVGSLLAHTTHRRGPALPGLASLNLLSEAHLAAAVPLFLARDEIRRSQALSDPDLPRLWILANGLYHGVPGSVMRQVPARSVGPAAAIIETHDDLVGWAAMATAVQHMEATVRAAVEGRHWLETLSRLATADDRALAAGVISLTRPGAATRLARPGANQVTLDQARWATRTAPDGVVDLTDQALKSICDRNGWLMGSPGESTQRNLTQRAVLASGRQLRDDLTGGDTEALSRTAAAGADDAELDRGVFRNHPPSPDVVAAQQFLRATSTEALSRFAGFEAPPRASYAEALAHRFPAHLSRNTLVVVDPARLLVRPDVERPPAQAPGAAPAVRRRIGHTIGAPAATRLPLPLSQALDDQAALVGVTRPELMRRYLAEAITANMAAHPEVEPTAAAPRAARGSPQRTADDGAPAVDAEAIIEILNRHQVRYVTIGAFAAQQQGAVLPATAEIDITPATGRPNLQRLSAALRELGARVRHPNVVGGLAFDHDGTSLGRADSWNLVSAHGRLQVSFWPSGTGGYHDMIRHARMGKAGDHDVAVASLVDIVRSTTATGRDKDMAALPTLYEALERQQSLLRPPEPPQLSGPELGPPR